MTDLVITDTSCLIALDRVGQLALLPALFVVHAPMAVAEEFGRRPPWLHVEKVEQTEELAALREKLDRGEAEAIMLARSYPNARLLIDELRGRTWARRLGLRITGTAGILLAAKRAKLLSAVKPVLDALIRQHKFRLDERLYAQVLEAAGEA